MRFHAENAFAHWCVFTPTGSYPGVDTVRNNLRTSLDEVADYLKTFRPDDWKDVQRFWSALETAEAEAEHAAELAEGQEEEDAELAEGQEEEDTELAEGQEEEDAEVAEDQEEEVAAATAGGKIERLAALAEAQEEHEAELAEGELEEGADLAPETIAALNKAADEAYDAQARARAPARTPDNTMEAVNEGPKVRNKPFRRLTRIPVPVTAASTRSPRASKAPDRYE
jgi:hypothetical protein